MNQRYLQIALLVVLAAGLAACSPAASSLSSNQGDFASTASVTLPTTISNVTATTSARALVQCDGTAASTYHINLAADVQNGTVNTNYVYVRFTSLPAGFANDSSTMRLFEVMGVGASSYYTNQTPITLTVIDPSTGNILLQGANWIRWSDISAQAAAIGYTDPNLFFSRMIILANLNDPSGQYESLLSVHYDVSGSVLDQANTLLPVFNADPAAYATKNDGTARSSIMTSIHPFAGQNISGLTTAQLQTEANAFCSAFN